VYDNSPVDARQALTAQRYGTAIMKHQRAFTLIEILIVVVILGILAAVIVPQFTNASKDAISNSMAVNAKLIRTQIQIHAAKGDVELTDDGFPVNLDGAWFAGGGLPRHGYSNKRIQVILAPSFLSDRIYPLFKTYNVNLANPNTAWYNPTNGAFAMRVPNNLGDDETTLAAFNQANGLSLTDLNQAW